MQEYEKAMCTLNPKVSRVRWLLAWGGAERLPSGAVCETIYVGRGR